MTVPIPINLDTINKLYGLSLTSFELEEFFEKIREPRMHLKTSEDVVIMPWEANSTKNSFRDIR